MSRHRYRNNVSEHVLRVRFASCSTEVSAADQNMMRWNSRTKEIINRTPPVSDVHSYCSASRVPVCKIHACMHTIRAWCIHKIHKNCHYSEDAARGCKCKMCFVNAVFGGPSPLQSATSAPMNGAPHRSINLLLLTKACTPF